MAGIFHTARIKGARRQKMLDDTVGRFPGIFASRDTAAAYMNQIIMPHSRRWAYCGNGKSGTSSTKRFLFELEFATPLTAGLKLTSDINPDVAAHHLATADVFRPVSFMGKGLDAINNTLRLTTVRHPAARAVSAFLYLCRSDDESHVWFARDRLRMNALVGFDWNRDTKTASGFVKFLRFIEITIAEAGADTVNAHWRPQVDNIKPEIFRPHLVGHTENLESFYRAIARRLDRPLAPDWHAPIANRAESTDTGSALLTPEAVRLLNRIYRADFDTFGYDPDTSATTAFNVADLSKSAGAKR